MATTQAGLTISVYRAISRQERSLRHPSSQGKGQEYDPAKCRDSSVAEVAFLGAGKQVNRSSAL
jgi:hypothetical protein